MLYSEEDGIKIIGNFWNTRNREGHMPECKIILNYWPQNSQQMDLCLMCREENSFGTY